MGARSTRRTGFGSWGGPRDPHSHVDDQGRPLSNTSGAVLDPIFTCGGGSTWRREPARASCSPPCSRPRGRPPCSWPTSTAIPPPSSGSRRWPGPGAVQLHHLGIGAEEAPLFQQLANRIIHADSGMRAPAAVLMRNTLGPSALWAHRISGDLPIVLVRIDEVEDRGIVRQLLRAHEYWRLKGLASISSSSTRSRRRIFKIYRGPSRVGPIGPARPRRHPGGLGLRPARRPPLARRARLLERGGRVILLSRQGSLAEQVARAERPHHAQARAATFARGAGRARAAPAASRGEFDNGLGGFVRDGREYMIALGEGQWDARPVDQRHRQRATGFQVSESGAGYTWAENSRENQPHALVERPVTDPPGETIYLRDDDTGDLWGPTALPTARRPGPITVVPGRIQPFHPSLPWHRARASPYVALEDPVKISRLRVANRSTSARTLTVTAYVEWVLGPLRSTTAPFVVTGSASAPGRSSPGTPGPTTSRAGCLPRPAGEADGVDGHPPRSLGGTAPSTIRRRSNEVSPSRGGWAPARSMRGRSRDAHPGRRRGGGGGRPPRPGRVRDRSPGPHRAAIAMADSTRCSRR